MDELWLIIYPMTLGEGKKLFENGTSPAAFKLMESSVTPSGLVMVHYKQDGRVRTRTVGD